MKQLLLLFFVLIYFSIFSQLTFQIKDINTLEIIPFAKIIPNDEYPKIADLDGYFQLNTENTSVQIKAIGYRDTSIFISSITEKTIFLIPVFQEINEVVVQAGENPAHRIIRQAIANRKKNSPTENDAFSYNAYNKLCLTIDPSIMDSIPKNLADTNYLEVSRLVDSMHLFLVESTSERKFMPPYKNKEIITSYKVSGFNAPLFSTIFNSIQSFSFYENQFQILEKSYINPIAFGGINRYLFILEDTIIRQTDTTYAITFRPKKGKNFDGLKGQLFINTNGFAIEKVVAEPYLDTTFNIKIIQEYEFIEGKKWFPVKLSTEFSFQSNVATILIGDKKAKVIGKGNSYLSNIKINPPLSRKDFDEIDFETAVDADRKTDQDWDSLRKYQLTEQEKNTYKIVDSLVKAENFDKLLYISKVLSTGKIPIGYFNADLSKILTYNQFEGMRFGFALENSDKLLKRISIGAYFGYGAKDKHWKYGAYSKFNLIPKRNLFLNFSYKNDVLERGGNFFHKDVSKFNMYDGYRKLYIKNMDYQRVAEMELNGYLIPRIRISIFVNYQRIFISDSYQFNPINPSIFKPEKMFELAEAGIEISWQYREKIIQLGYRRVSLGSKFPVLTVKATKGIKGDFESNYDYTRFYTNLYHDISLRGIGKLSYSFSANKTIGEVPIMLMSNAAGTNSILGKNAKLKIFAPNTFQTMKPSTFYTNESITLFAQLSLLTWKTKLSFFQPQLSFFHGIGFGRMKNQTNHSIPFETMQKGYLEGGIILDKLYVSKYNGVGFGVFTNYGAYAVPKFEKNLVYKISFNWNL